MDELQKLKWKRIPPPPHPYTNFGKEAARHTKVTTHSLGRDSHQPGGLKNLRKKIYEESILSWALKETVNVPPRHANPVIAEGCSFAAPPG